MPYKGPHISIDMDRLQERVFAIPSDEFRSWPETAQHLARNLAAELFLLRYNPFIKADMVRKSVDAAFERARPYLSAKYVTAIDKGVTAFWQGYNEYQNFRETVIKRLQEFLPEECIDSRPNVLVECSTDATDLRMELPMLVLTPFNSAQVQRIVRLANELLFAIVPRGGGSGLTGGAIPAMRGAVVLSLSRMKDILHVDVENKILCAQAGVITIAAIQAAAKHGLLFTVDPASKTASSIGGNISENSGGPFAFEYGTTIDNIYSFKMVTASGELISVHRKDHPRTKIMPGNTAIFEIYGEDGQLKDTIVLDGLTIRAPGLGKDVTNKYLGGLPGVQKEGVDGIITEACFTLYDRLPHTRILCLEFFGRSMHNAMLVIKDLVGLRDKIRLGGDLVKMSALEEFNTKYVQAIEYQKKSQNYEGDPISVLLVQLDSSHPDALDEIVHDIVDIADPYDKVDVFVARDEKEGERFWEDRHKLSAIAKRTSGFKINEDIVIPMEVIPEFADFIEGLNIRYLAKAYRKALLQVSQFAGVSVDDEFIEMELKFAGKVIKGNVTTKQLVDQEFELQINFFFQDLRGRYPGLYKEFESILKNLHATRIAVATHMHAGDGNCHVNIPVNSNDPEMLHEAEEVAAAVMVKVMELNGQVSGEHGIGITKIAFLPEEKIKALAAYKEIVDPRGILNPGKLTQRGLPVAPYTFSFNRLIQDITRSALNYDEKERLINLLTNIQICTRCGKCKQVCPMFYPQRGLMFHPRNKNISMGALIEAIYYTQLQLGKPDDDVMSILRDLMEHCTGCGKCTSVCPVKINTRSVIMDMRAYLEERGQSGHPLKSRLLHYLAAAPQKRVPQAAKLAAIGSGIQKKALGFVPASWRRRLTNPMFGSPSPTIGLLNLPDTLHLNRGSLFEVEGATATVFYFPGCGASLFYRSIGLAGLYLLLKSGLNVLLPEEHLCCGYPLYASGCDEAFKANRERNLLVLNHLFERYKEQGMVINTVLTSCGSCRDGLASYDLPVMLGDKSIRQFDISQYLLERLPDMRGKGPDRLVYHASCHSEWSGQNAAKAPDICAKALESLTGAAVALSPGCCGESGLGAMTSPALYNKLRARKQEQLAQDLEAYPLANPILVGCPSCKIGISRSMLEMGLSRDVLHTLEHFAALIGGPKWEKEILDWANRIRRRKSDLLKNNTALAGQ